MMRYLLALIALSLAFPSWAVAQGTVQVFGGDRVRLTAPDCQLQKETASLLSIEDEVLSARSGENEIRCPVGDLTRLEVSLGERKWNHDSVKGMRYGFLLGLAMGVVLVARSDFDNGFPAVDALLVTAGMGATGFLVGTAVGAIRDPEDWVDVPLPLAPPSFLLAREGRIRLRFSLALRK